MSELPIRRRLDRRRRNAGRPAGRSNTTHRDRRRGGRHGGRRCRCRRHAQDVVADARTSMVLFVLLSGALTGIAESKLAPGFDLQKSIPGSDPINIKQEY